MHCCGRTLLSGGTDGSRERGSHLTGNTGHVQKVVGEIKLHHCIILVKKDKSNLERISQD